MDEDKPTWNILPSEGQDPATDREKEFGQNSTKWSSYSQGKKEKVPFIDGPVTPVSCLSVLRPQWQQSKD